jgi:hypothetical protein
MASDLLLLGKSKSRFPAGMTKKEADGSRKKSTWFSKKEADGSQKRKHMVLKKGSRWFSEEAWTERGEMRDCSTARFAQNDESLGCQRAQELATAQQKRRPRRAPFTAETKN